MAMKAVPMEFGSMRMRDSADRLVLDIQAMQGRAHKLGLHMTAHALNNAMNVCGWEQAGNTDAAARAAKGERPA